jgi:hypothetical protein
LIGQSGPVDLVKPGQPNRVQIRRLSASCLLDVAEHLIRSAFARRSRVRGPLTAAGSCVAHGSCGIHRSIDRKRSAAVRSCPAETVVLHASSVIRKGECSRRSTEARLSRIEFRSVSLLSCVLEAAEHPTRSAFARRSRVRGPRTAAGSCVGHGSCADQRRSIVRSRPLDRPQTIGSLRSCTAGTLPQL